MPVSNFIEIWSRNYQNDACTIQLDVNYQITMSLIPQYATKTKLPSVICYIYIQPIQFRGIRLFRILIKEQNNPLYSDISLKSTVFSRRKNEKNFKNQPQQTASRIHFIEILKMIEISGLFESRRWSRNDGDTQRK